MNVNARRAVKAAAVGFMLITLAACSAAPAPPGQDPDVAALGHVHGLGTDTADGSLYVASHFGVFRVSEDGTADRVADRWQDTMAFTVVGPGEFLASGHPDLREDLPVQLGLIESTDAARTWQPVSLHGDADFHALEATGERLYGYDAVTGRLLVTTDRHRWTSLAEGQLVDLAADPSDSDRVLATTPDGSMVQYHTSKSQVRQIEGAPPLVFIDWPQPDMLAGLAADGAVYLSSDAANTWQRTGGPPGDAQAIDVAAGQWHVATSHGVFRSTDNGRRWHLLVGHRG